MLFAGFNRAVSALDGDIISISSTLDILQIEEKAYSVIIAFSVKSEKGESFAGEMENMESKIFIQVSKKPTKLQYIFIILTAGEENEDYKQK
ncbi:hypothetical protein [Tepidanaerobacter sp. EBM-49]|uniref:hypothetical protein n=1 Tax=Tepidanaerobacter sp. EBM-49 TaxID=1918504 RepID=UPI000A460C39|nr:hypothetical protein [Tepidanaerobacter sp. EBM-49]